LEQQVYQITNNFDIFARDHTITVGTSFEAFLFDNSFNLGPYDGGSPGGTFGLGFESVDAFLDFVDSGQLDPIVEGVRQTFETNNANDSWALAETNLGQWAVYAQDNWTVSNEFTLTYGLRVDLPLYFNTAKLAQENIDRKGGTIDEGGTYALGVTYFDENGDPIQFNSTELPDQSPLFSPRAGFNWDVLGDRTLQLRGGS